MNIPHSALRTPHLEAVLFDLDGTLIHSIEHIIACWQHTVRTSLGREITREEVLPTLGRALLECFEEIAPGRSVEMREVYRAYQKATHDTDVTLVSGTHETLKRLCSAGYRLGVVTSKGVTVATEGLNLFNLTSYFETLVTYEDTDRHKPNPDPLLLAAERMGIEPPHTTYQNEHDGKDLRLPFSQIIYIGDAVFDIQAGKAAGMRTGAVTWGAGSRAELVAEKPDYIFDSMEEVASALVGGREVASS
jgi:pyrophosphatase PpaX